MTLLFWLSIFVISLVVLVKGADWLLESAEKIGLAVGLSSFIVGVVIVGLGTSLPELFSGLMALFRGVNEIVAANAIGSNIANILLVVGVAAIISKKLTVTKDLIDLDLPLLTISTVIFVIAAWDRQISLRESILLLVVYLIYLGYTFMSREDDDGKTKRPKLKTVDFVWLIAGIIGLVVGAKYLIDSVIKISEMLSLAPGVVSLVAVAFGTSLPELLVSVKAALNNKPEVAIGNIFGSNIFNILVVIGIPGLFSRLQLDEKTFAIGLPVMAVTTLIFVISGISKRIHMWEGAMYLVVYLFFIGKLFGFL